MFGGEAAEAYRVAQWAVDLVGGDPMKGSRTGVGSPLAVSLFWRGLAGCSLGRAGWRDDMRRGIAMQRSVDAHAVALSTLISVAYICRHSERRNCSRTNRRCGKPPKLCGWPKRAATMSASNLPSVLRAWS